MPIKPIPPQGKAKSWYGRGTYLGRFVNKSTGARTEAVAKRIIAKWEREIERGEFAVKGEITFSDAALAYMNAGGEKQFMTPLLKYFGRTPVREIGQAQIDAAAVAIKPNGTPSTRNRTVYAPVSVVLKRAGVDFTIKRPKGSSGRKATAWFWEEQAFAIFEQADKLDPEFGTLCMFYCYTGLRLSEALRLRVDDVRLSESYAYLPDSKNGDPRPVFLPPVVVAALANLPSVQSGRGKLFRYSKGGHLYSLLKTAAFKAGVDLPERGGFHIFRHTWATWMRRHAGLDTKGLVGTGAWKDIKSADRYAHVVVSEESERAVMLPTPGRKTGWV